MFAPEVVDDTTDSAVLDVLYREVRSVGIATEADCIRVRARIREIRTWASNLEPGPVRKAYDKWLSHYENSVGERLASIERARRVDAAVADVPKPPRSSLTR